MEDTIKLEVPKVEAEQVLAQIADCLRQIRQTQQAMAQEQTKIDRLREDTQQNLAEIRKLVA